MNKSTLHEMFGCQTKIQIPRSIWLPALLRWALALAVLIVPQAGQALERHATVGAQSSDKGHQALAFLPNEIWINKEDSITWTIDVDEPHTVTFIPDQDIRPPFFQAPTPAPSSTPPFPFDGSKAVSSTGDLASIAKGDTFRVQFLKTGDFKLVCLFHENMTGVVHVLEKNAPLPHNQDFRATFPNPGTFPYKCTLHDTLGMTGRVVVH
jgi:plastocyanin